MKKTKKKELVICFDGVHNLSTNSIANSIREDNILRANKLKALADSYKIPVIATVEVRKKDNKQSSDPPTMHDIMETSKFSYNASVVLMLHLEQTNDAEDPNPNLVINVEKNKLSSFKGIMKLKFFKAKGYLVCSKVQNQVMGIFKAISHAVSSEQDDSYKY